MKVGIKQFYLLFIEKYTEIMVADLNLLGSVGDLYCFSNTLSMLVLNFVIEFLENKDC